MVGRDVGGEWYEWRWVRHGKVRRDPWVCSGSMGVFWIHGCSGSMGLGSMEVGSLGVAGERRDISAT